MRPMRRNLLQARTFKVLFRNSQPRVIIGTESFLCGPDKCLLQIGLLDEASKVH